MFPCGCNLVARKFFSLANYPDIDLVKPFKSSGDSDDGLSWVTIQQCHCPNFKQNLMLVLCQSDSGDMTAITSYLMNITFAELNYREYWLFNAVQVKTFYAWNF
jgi:hypothetical protein